MKTDTKSSNKSSNKSSDKSSNKSFKKSIKRFLPIPLSVIYHLEKEPKITDFNLLKSLGTGSFGRVLLAQHKQTKQKYAIKIIDKKNKTNISGKLYFRREIEIMYKVSHPNILHLYSHFEDDKNCYFLMEYCSNGNLYNHLASTNTRSIRAIATILRQLISAVAYLHSMNIIHRDIKPENVLMSDNNEIKLTDFGWSNYINDDIRSTFCGTPIYLAPEIVLNKGHDEHVDIWCIGVMLFEMIVGRPPFCGSDRNTLMNNIIKLNINWPKSIHKEAKDLISKILKFNPQHRLSLIDILKHPFINKYMPSNENYIIPGSANQIHGIYIVNKGGIYIKPKIKREISPLPYSKLHLDKIEIIKIGKNNVLNTHKNNDCYSNIKTTIGSNKELDETLNSSNTSLNHLKNECREYKKKYEESLLIIKKLNADNKILESKLKKIEIENYKLIYKVKEYELEYNIKMNVKNNKNYSRNYNRFQLTPDKRNLTQIRLKYNNKYFETDNKGINTSASKDNYIKCKTNRKLNKYFIDVLD